MHSGCPPPQRQGDARGSADTRSSAEACLSWQKVQGREANRRRHRLTEPTTKALCQTEGRSKSHSESMVKLSTKNFFFKKFPQVSKPRKTTVSQSWFPGTSKLCPSGRPRAPCLRPRGGGSDATPRRGRCDGAPPTAPCLKGVMPLLPGPSHDPALDRSRQPRPLSNRFVTPRSAPNRFPNGQSPPLLPRCRRLPPSPSPPQRGPMPGLRVSQWMALRGAIAATGGGRCSGRHTPRPALRSGYRPRPCPRPRPPPPPLVFWGPQGRCGRPPRTRGPPTTSLRKIAHPTSGLWPRTIFGGQVPPPFCCLLNNVDLQLPLVTLEPPSVTLQPPSVTLQPPSVTLQPPPVTLQPPSVSLQVPSVTLQPPSVTLQPPSVTLQPPSVTLQPPSVTLQPPSVSLQVPSNSVPKS